MALLTLCLGYFLVVLDGTVLNVALPALGADLGAGTGALQWVVDAYALTFAALLLGAGALGDRIGPARCFRAGFVVFTAASAAGAAAPGIGVLVGARAVQGIGAALLVPASLALLAAAYPEPAARARALGTWGGVAGCGAAAGPIVGGVLVSAAGWRSVLLVNAPFGLLGLALARRLAAVRTVDRPKPPFVSQLAAVVALGALTLAIIEAGSRGLVDPVSAAAATVAALGAAVFARAERSARAPLLPRGLLRRRPVAAATAVGLLINLGFYGQLFVVNLYLQDVRGRSALGAALAMLPEGAMAIAGSLAAGRIGARMGPRAPMLAGLGLGAAGILGFAGAGSATPYLALLPALLAAGFGMALTMPSATAVAIRGAPADRAGTSGALLNAARQVGGLLGVALLGALVAGPHFVAGLHAAAVAGAAAFALAAAVAAALLRTGA